MRGSSQQQASCGVFSGTFNVSVSITTPRALCSGLLGDGIVLSRIFPPGGYALTVKMATNRAKHLTLPTQRKRPHLAMPRASRCASFAGRQVISLSFFLAWACKGGWRARPWPYYCGTWLPGMGVVRDAVAAHIESNCDSVTLTHGMESAGAGLTFGRAGGGQSARPGRLSRLRS